MNEQYAYKTSVDVRRTFETKRKNGEFIGDLAPYGLMERPDDKNSLMIDEEATEVVRDILLLCRRGNEQKRDNKTATKCMIEY